MSKSKSASPLVTEAMLDATLDAKLDAKFSAFRHELELSLAKYFGAASRQIAESEKRLTEKLDARCDEHQTILDGFLRRQEIDERERLTTNNQVDRHEVWITQLAKKTDTKLSSV